MSKTIPKSINVKFSPDMLSQVSRLLVLCGEESGERGHGRGGKTARLIRAAMNVSERNSMALLTEYSNPHAASAPASPPRSQRRKGKRK